MQYRHFQHSAIYTAKHEVGNNAGNKLTKTVPHSWKTPQRQTACPAPTKRDTAYRKVTPGHHIWMATHGINSSLDKNTTRLRIGFSNTAREQRALQALQRLLFLPYVQRR